MDKVKFVSLLGAFHEKMVENDKFYNSLEELGLMDMVEQMLEHDCACLLIEALGNNDKEQEWLRYLIYECDFDMNEFNQRTYIDNSNLKITNWGDFYEFIKRN